MSAALSRSNILLTLAFVFAASAGVMLDKNQAQAQSLVPAADGSESQEARENRQYRALAVGHPGGPVFDELKAHYQIFYGDGTQDPADYDALIYDGRQTSARQIQRLQDTAGFFFSGKQVYLINAVGKDFTTGLGKLSWVVPEAGTPAADFFATWDSNGVRQQTVIVDFPRVYVEKLKPTAVRPTSAKTIASSDSQADSVDDSEVSVALTLENSQRWFTLAQNAFDAAQRGQLAGLTGVEEQADTEDVSAPILSGQSVRSFSELQPIEVNQAPALYQQPPLSTASLFTKRGSCYFRAYRSKFDLHPGQVTPGTIHATLRNIFYAMLEETPPGSGRYQQKVVARQFVSTDGRLLAKRKVGSANFSWCPMERVLDSPASPIGCGYRPECFDFDETETLNTSLGFIADIETLLTPGDPHFIRLEKLPRPQNGTSNVTASEEVKTSVAVGVQSTVDADLSASLTKNPEWKLKSKILNVTANYNKTWTWSKSQTINLLDWSVAGSDPRNFISIVDFFATGGTVNTWEALNAYQSHNAPSNALDFSNFNSLQTGSLQLLSQVSWQTGSHGLVLPRKIATSGRVAFRYGEVYNSFAPPEPCDSAHKISVNFRNNSPTVEVCASDYGVRSFIHEVRPAQSYLFDWSDPVLRPPQKADWSVENVDVGPLGSDRRFFPISGEVTLSQPDNNHDTQLLLAAEVAKSPGATFYVPPVTAIKDLPLTIVIPKGATSATFTASAQRTGDPYNVVWVAWKPETNQVASYEIAIPRD